MRYIPLSSDTYFIFFVTHIGVISGALTLISARNVFIKDKIDYSKIVHSTSIIINNQKPLKILILITAIIGFYGAYQHWMVLIQKFGSITAVIMRANLIYRMRVAGELEGVIPYLSIFPFAGIVLGGIYTAIKSRISLLALLPFLAVILKDVASVGRSGIFVGFLFYITSFFLFRHSLSENPKYNSQKNKRSLLISSAVVLTIVVGSLSIVKNVRGSFEAFKGKSQTFNELKNVPFVSPSMYLYFSSNVGVFSKYFDLQAEDPMIGENTLLPIYNLMSRFDVVKHPEFYPRGYFIPMWANSATYLKDLHADFGPLGLFSIPFFLSFMATFYWFRFYERGDLISFTFLVYINIILSFSVFYLITRAAFWLLSFLFLLIIIPFTEKYLYYLYIKSRKSLSKTLIL
jgi:oligosaccharide repeat unit polymerase